METRTRPTATVAPRQRVPVEIRASAVNYTIMSSRVRGAAVFRKVCPLQDKALLVAALAAAAREESSACGVLEDFANTLVGPG